MLPINATPKKLSLLPQSLSSEAISAQQKQQIITRRFSDDQSTNSDVGISLTQFRIFLTPQSQ